MVLSSSNYIITAIAHPTCEGNRREKMIIPPPPPPVSLETARYCARRLWVVTGMCFLLEVAVLTFVGIMGSSVGVLVPLLAALITVSSPAPSADSDGAVVKRKTASAIEDARCVQGDASVATGMPPCLLVGAGSADEGHRRRPQALHRDHACAVSHQVPDGAQSVALRQSGPHSHSMSGMGRWVPIIMVRLPCCFQQGFKACGDACPLVPLWLQAQARSIQGP